MTQHEPKPRYNAADDFLAYQGGQAWVENLSADELQQQMNSLQPSGKFPARPGLSETEELSLRAVQEQSYRAAKNLVAKDFLKQENRQFHEENQNLREQVDKLSDPDREAEQQAALAAAEKLARTDTLTGLPNRLGFMEKYREVTQGDRPVGVFFIDLNGFKQVNDTLGHTQGDHLLQQVATKLESVVRTQPKEVPEDRRTVEPEGPPLDIVAHAEDTKDEDEEEVVINGQAHRPHGDEFFVLVWLQDADDEDAMNKIASKMIGAIDSLRETDYKLVELNFGAAVGYDIWTPGKKPDNVLSLAEARMYEAKKARETAQEQVAS